MMIGVLFGNFCSSCFIKISVSFYVKITFFPDFFDNLTLVVPACYWIFRYGKFRYAFEKLFTKGNGAWQQKFPIIKSIRYASC